MSPNIIIRKHKVKVTTAHEPLALRVRNHLTDELQHGLITMLEQVFSKFDQPDVYINIDKLNVNIGAVSIQDFESRFFQIVAPYLAIEFQKQLQQNGHEATGAAHEQQKDHGANTIEPLKVNSGKHQQLVVLLYFLKKGVYPWWHKNSDQTPAQIIESMGEEESQKILLEIFKLKKSGSLIEVQNFIDRLFNHLPPSQYVASTNRLLALLNNASLTSNINVLLQNAAQLTPLFSISTAIYQRQLFSFIINGINNDQRNIIHDFLYKLKSANNVSHTELITKVEALHKNHTAVNDDLKHILQTLTGRKNDQTKDFKTGLNSNPNDHINPSEAPFANSKDRPLNPNENPEARRKSPAATTSEIVPSTDNAEGFYINNSGLVLLHPFLQSFFQELGLLNEHHKFLNVATQYKAAVLLYYLQCGEVEYKEWEMALNKIICHIPVEEVLPAGIQVTDIEKAECETLLKTVINYWEALKGSGIQALQQTFILREGKISFKQEFWLVQVERTGTDILLDRLPWGFNTVKLPWLPHIIFTEW